MTKASRMILTAVAAVTMTGILTVGPAFAQDETCDTRAANLAELIKAPSATIDAKSLRQAQRLHTVGVKLCGAGERFGAAKKFAQAEEILGAQTAEAAAPAAQ